MFLFDLFLYPSDLMVQVTGLMVATAGKKGISAGVGLNTKCLRACVRARTTRPFTLGEGRGVGFCAVSPQLCLCCWCEPRVSRQHRGEGDEGISYYSITCHRYLDQVVSTRTDARDLIVRSRGPARLHTEMQAGKVLSGGMSRAVPKAFHLRCSVVAYQSSAGVCGVPVQLTS